MKRTPLSATILLLFISTCLHIAAGSMLGLSADGAHYVLYGVHLDWSYFDHPPLVGWLQALTLLVSKSNLALRFWAIFFNVAWSIVLYRITRKLFNDKSAWLAFFTVALAQSAIVLNLLGIIFLPQVLLLFFGSLTLLQTYNIVVLQKHSVYQFIYWGVLLGLSALSEYSASFVALAVFLFILFQDRPMLLNLKLWLTAIIALLFCTPIIYWNSIHHWASFHYQSNHIFSGSSWSILKLIRSQLIQVFVYSPTIYILAIMATINQWPRRKRPEVSLLFCFSLPMFAIFFYSNGITLGLPHWTALAWLSIIPLISYFVFTNWSRLSVKILVFLSISYSILIFGIIYSQAFFHWLNLPLGQDPFLDLYGWQNAGIAARQEVQLLKQEYPHRRAMLFVPNWSLASRIGWYAHYPIQVAQYKKISQFQFWYGKPDELSYGIVVVPYRWKKNFQYGDIPGQFIHCHFLKTVDTYVAQHLVDQFSLYYCQHYVNKIDSYNIERTNQLWQKNLYQSN